MSGDTFRYTLYYTSNGRLAAQGYDDLEIALGAFRDLEAKYRPIFIFENGRRIWPTDGDAPLDVEGLSQLEAELAARS